MSELIRFGVSIEQDLLEHFDRLNATRNYSTRSEALRDLIREALIQQKIEGDSATRVLGSLTLVYDHHVRHLSQEMGEIQHDFHDNILSVMHLHVSHEDCLEIIAVSGIISEIIEFSDKLLSLKGIKNGKLFLTLSSSTITS